MARLPGSTCWLAGLVSTALLLGGPTGWVRCSASDALATTDRPLFDPPTLATLGDEVLLVSTRKIGTVCDSESMQRGLHCLRLIAGPAETASRGPRSAATTTPSLPATWVTTDWRRLLCHQDQRPTIIYVHGNRVASGQDGQQGLSVYRSLKANCPTIGPVRFVIWSWPAEQIARPIKDYLVKARRTNAVAWQLAWLLDKLPNETQLSLVGYSYGTRVVSGATHLLAGGRLDDLQLDDRVHPQRLPVRAALLAAAYDADWIQPGKFYSRSLAQIDRLVISTNELDPAMRFFHFSNGRGRMDALGKSGVHQPTALGSTVRTLQSVDFTREVGRSHSLHDYLAAEAKMKNIWHELL